jgi:Family of unknown function (DUF6325)
VADAREPADRPDGVAPDLVSYLVVAVPDESALAGQARALVQLVEAGTVRILDLVVIERDSEGAVSVRELETVESIAPLRDVDGEVGGMLSEHDIALAALALRRGSVGIVIVTEDRWAQPLSDAAQRAGGLLIGGERIPASRVRAAQPGPSDESRGEP